MPYLTAYDPCYVAVAEALGAALATLKRRLVRAPGGLNRASRRVARDRPSLGAIASGLLLLSGCVLDPARAAKRALKRQ